LKRQQSIIRGLNKRLSMDRMTITENLHSSSSYNTTCARGISPHMSGCVQLSTEYPQ